MGVHKGEECEKMGKVKKKKRKKNREKENKWLFE